VPLAETNFPKFLSLLSYARRRWLCRRRAPGEDAPTWSSSMDQGIAIRAAWGAGIARRLWLNVAVCWPVQEVAVGTCTRELEPHKAAHPDAPPLTTGARSSEHIVASRNRRRAPVHAHRTSASISPARCAWCWSSCKGYAAGAERQAHPFDVNALSSWRRPAC